MVWGLAGLSFFGGPARSVVAPPTAKGCSSVPRRFPEFFGGRNSLSSNLQLRGL